MKTYDGKSISKKAIQEVLRTMDSTKIFALYARIYGRTTRADVYDFIKEYAPTMKISREAYRLTHPDKHKEERSRVDSIVRSRNGFYEGAQLHIIVNYLRRQIQDVGSSYAKRPMYGRTHLYFCSPFYGHKDYNKFAAIKIEGNERFCELLVAVGDKYFGPVYDSIYRMTVNTREDQTERTSVFILKKKWHEISEYYGDLSFVKYCNFSNPCFCPQRKVEDLEGVKWWGVQEWFGAFNESESVQSYHIEKVSVSDEQMEELQRNYTANGKKSIPGTMTMPVHGRMEYDGKDGLIDLGDGQRVKYHETEKEIRIGTICASDKEKAEDLILYVRYIAYRRMKRICVLAIPTIGAPFNTTEEAVEFYKEFGFYKPGDTPLMIR